ncbi:MAG: alpha/beta hydrolase [Agathobacter sp.]|nr:alpha/beta hydrolase [Agathobacter sp.]
MVINVIIVLLILILLYVLFSFVIVSIAYKKQGFDKHVEYDEVISPDEVDVPISETDVKTEDGLNIHLYETEVDDPKGVIILLTGITHLSITQFFGHAKMFADAGYVSVLVEARAHGKSDGKHITFGTQDVRDVRAAVKHIKNRLIYKDLPLIIMGFSMGAATAVNSASLIPEIDALISCASFSRWEDVCMERMIREGCPRFIAKCLASCVNIHGFIKFGKDFITHQPVKTIQQIGNKPILMIHSDGDDTVFPVNHNRLKKSYKETNDGYNAFFVRRPIQSHYVTSRENFMKPWLDTEYKDLLLGFLDNEVYDETTSLL